MSAGTARSAPLTPFDFFEVRAVCRSCGHSDEAHTIRTWWSAPNRTCGWDAPTTSGTTYTLGAQPQRLSPKRTRFRAESRCGGCESALNWWIVSDRGRVIAIQQADRTEVIRLVPRDARAPAAVVAGAPASASAS